MVESDALENRSDEGALRFNLAVQRSRLAIYVVSFVIAGIAKLTGTLDVSWTAAIIALVVCVAQTLFFYRLFQQRVDERLGMDLNPYWIAIDALATTTAVYLTGGAQSPWFIWYIATAGAAAFVLDLPGLVAVVLGDSILYIGMLVYGGEIRGLDHVFFLAMMRLLFLFGASSFFLAGILNLKRKRMLIRNLRNEDGRKMDELVRLTRQLEERTQELSESNRRMFEADRMKSQFLATVSHELRTPMNSIIGFSEILVQRLEGAADPKHLAFLRNILTSGQHLLDVINDILDLAKIEAGRMELHPETFRSDDAIELVCNVVRGMAVQYGVDIATELPQDLPALRSDPAKFKQILYNLLSNAIKFSPAGSTVSVSARKVEAEKREDEALEMAVTDHGNGIPPEEVPHVFDEFHRVAQPQSWTEGTGLGLALVRRFVEMQGGAVRVESEVGAGSTFFCMLPLHGVRPPAPIPGRGAHSVPPPVGWERDLPIATLDRNLGASNEH
ncbi:MAG: HAMP domain-containing sensor histidine kinase [Thermoanaerobaculia bacterium]